MTAITTEQELINLTPGTSVRVDTNEWERVTDGFRRDGITLPSTYFTGAINAGLVQTGPLYAEGQWWQEGSTYYLLLRRIMNDDGTPATSGGCELWNAAWFYGDSFSSVERTSMNQYVRRATDVPEALQNQQHLATQLGARLLDSQQTTNTVNAEVRRLRTENNTLQNTLSIAQSAGLEHATVRDAIVDAADSDREIDDANDLLDALGLDRIETEVTVTVRVDFRRDWTPSTREAEQALDIPDVADVEDSVVVEWSEDYEITVTGSGCMCGDVEYEQIVAKVQEQNPGWVDYYNDSEQHTCSED